MWTVRKKRIIQLSILRDLLSHTNHEIQYREVFRLKCQKKQTVKLEWIKMFVFHPDQLNFEELIVIIFLPTFTWTHTQSLVNQVKFIMLKQDCHILIPLITSFGGSSLFNGLKKTICHERPSKFRLTFIWAFKIIDLSVYMDQSISWKSM